MKVKLPQGLGGGPSNMQSMLKQAQKMQEDMLKAQEELENAEIEGVAQGDAVVVTMNGKKIVSSISINPDYVDVDGIDDHAREAFHFILNRFL